MLDAQEVGANETDCNAKLHALDPTEAAKKTTELESLIEIVKQLGIEKQTSDSNTPLLPWNSDELSLRMAHEFWKELPLVSDSFSLSIDEFVHTTQENEENYSTYVSYYDQKQNDWEALNNLWDELCQDLGCPILNGESAEEQAKFIQLQLQLEDLKQQCLLSSSILVGIRFKLDELNSPIDRILDKKIQRLLNQP